MISSRIVASVFFLLLLCLLLPKTVHAQKPTAESKVEGVYLFNFLQYVDWPTNAFEKADSPYVVGILGKDPFGRTLEEILLDETVKGRKVQVRRFKTISEVKECHLLFISSSETANIHSIIAALKGRSILTVSDMTDFAHRGGMIRFVHEGNKIRFRINLDAAREANLSISAKLLQLAEVIRNEKPE